MTKKNIWKCLCLILASFMLSGCSLLENLFFTKSHVPEFAFSGYVYADGKALEGATVDCGVSSTTTDESGYFKFTGINKVVQVQASKDGYLFGGELVFVSSVSSEINFRGYKLFDKSGVVKNNNVTIPNVQISAVSENGTFETASNEYGEFYLPNLAGQVKVTAQKENFNFFKQSFTIDKEDGIVITGITDIGGKINVDENADASDFELYVNNVKSTINSDLTFTAVSVEPGSVIRLVSDKYKILEDTKIVESDLNEIEFDCLKIYNVTGTIYCGNVKLNNVNIKLDDQIITCPNGEFSYERLYGEKEISFELNGYVFAPIKVNFKNTNVEVKATTTVNGRVSLDVGSDYSQVSLKYDGKNIAIDSLGKFTIVGAEYGKVIIVSSEKYNVPQNIVLNPNENINLSLQRYYTLNVNVSEDNIPLVGATITVMGKDYETNQDGHVEINNLYGENEIVVTKSGYKFDSLYTCSYSNNTLNISGQEFYNLSGVVKSGDILIANAKIRVDENEIYSNQNGEFEINNVYGKVSAIIQKDNYNYQSITFTKNDNFKNINLSYNISGTITCGDLLVADAKVIVEDTFVLTDKLGKFTFKNLYGKNTITAQKDYYNVSSVEVNYGEDVNLSATYNITGVVNVKRDDSEELKPLQNFLIILIDKENGESKTTLTNEFGEYEFSGLNSTYALLYDMDTNLSLKPKSYDLRAGGNYDFSNNGYTFGGKIVCGDTPLEGVIVSVGSLQTTTNSMGEYNFGLVSNPGIITVYKEGYEFVADGHDGRASDKIDGSLEINYLATYKVTGTVKSGKTPLKNVNVTIQNQSCVTNENGEFEIKGLTGTNSITLQYLTFNFAGKKEISGFENLEYSATFDVNVKVLSGDILISNALVLLNGQNVTILDSLGQAKVICVAIGDTISFEKNGYVIESKQIDSHITDCQISAKYSITGTVSNCGVALYNVKITIKGTDKFVYTDEMGAFRFDDLMDKNTLQFELAGFNFDDLEIDGPSNYIVMSKFDVSGYVKVGTDPLENVKVTAGSIVAMTDKNGKFTIVGLNSPTVLTFEKTGYEFGETIEVSTPNTIYVSASYKIEGRVKSGDIILAGAKITSSSGDVCESDDNGKFTLTGITFKVSITVSMDGYNSKTISDISGYTSTIVANLDYSCVVSFSGVNNLKGVLITYNSKTETCNENVYTITGLKGETTISFAKDKCAFNPSKIIVSKNENIVISVVEMYSISGTIKTTSGVAVPYAIVYAGKFMTKTDAKGNYEFLELTGSQKLKVVMPSYNPTSEQEQEDIIVSKTGVYNITVADDMFVINFLNYAYDNLRHANSYQIFGGGDVVADAPVVGKQTQSVNLMYKQDKNGNKIFENKNKGSEIMGIDPNVALLSYFYTENGSRKVKYQQIKGSGNFSGDYANYTGSWDDTKDASWYKENYGVDSDGFSPYTINKSTITSVKGLSVSGDIISFTITLTTSGEAHSYYAKLMKVMCSSQDLSKFNSITLTYTITQSGLLRTMKIMENYVVKKDSIEVPVSATINYEFIINSLTETIKDIDVASPSSVLTSIKLGRETPTQTQSLNIKNENAVENDYITLNLIKVCTNANKTDIIKAKYVATKREIVL